MDKTKVSDTEFTRIWNRSANSLEVAEATGQNVKSCLNRAFYLRRNGHKLKRMPRPEMVAVDSMARRDPAQQPTDCTPGSKGKLEVLAERVRSGQELWHPEDRRLNANA
jgi:hypothetical protein